MTGEMKVLEEGSNGCVLYIRQEEWDERQKEEKMESDPTAWLYVNGRAMDGSPAKW